MIKNKILWYFNRLRTMSLPEIGYRVEQFSQLQKERFGFYGIDHKSQDYEDVFEKNFISNIPNIPEEYIKEFYSYDTFEFFGLKLDITSEINWHLDISTLKEFPKQFSKGIDIRSGKYGSAKVVWEINRLQFLLPLVLRYSNDRKTSDLELFVNILKSWISENPYLIGVNWYSNIEINIRLIVFYFCWQLLAQDNNLRNNIKFKSFCIEIWLPSIYEHAIYSYKNPSKYSSSNNHLIAEYSGLFTSSCCWSFKESKKWQTYSLRGLENEILRQFSINGINREEAAEYIQFIADFFLIPFSIGLKYGVEFSDNYKNRIKAIGEYIFHLLDVKKGYRKYGDEDDGKVLLISANPHFNNFRSFLISSALLFDEPKFKVIGGSYDLKNYLLWSEEQKEKYIGIQVSQKLGLNSAFYEKEGHFIFKKGQHSDGSEIYLHFNAAPLGYLSIAAHGHSDALSIALHVDGFPFIVDIGTYAYHTERKWRNYFVSTLGHNTLCVNDKNQAIQTGPTMWNKHYKTSILNVTANGGIEVVEAKHNGYNDIGCTHKREVKFFRDENVFEIVDNLNFKSNGNLIKQPWHLHPNIKLIEKKSNVFILSEENSKRKVRLTLDRKLKIELYSGCFDPLLGWYSKSFLDKEKSKTILGVYKNEESFVDLFTKIEII